MADHDSVLRQGQIVIRQHLDQLKGDAWRFLHDRGNDWTEAFDELTVLLARMDDPVVRALGMFAQIGFLAMCESWEPADEPGEEFGEPA